MEQSSTFEMISLGIEYILFAAFLIIFIQTMSIRDRFAETRAEQIDKIRGIRQYREFSYYDKGECFGEECKNHLYGDEVIELIRKYYDESDFEIYINKINKDGGEFVVNESTVALNPLEYSLETLQKQIVSTSEYHPYLIYDGITPSEHTTYQNSSLGTVTGIALFWKKNN